MTNRIIFQYLAVFLLTFSGRANDILHYADSLYLNKEYSAALSSYQDLVKNEKDPANDFNLKFKMGVCYLSAGEFDAAMQLFADLSQTKSDIPEYVDYYHFIATLGTNDIPEINQLGTRYLRTYGDHYLADSLRWHLAEYQYSNENYLAAANHYNKLLRKNDFRNHKPYLTKKLAWCKFHSGRVKESQDLMYQVIKKYPGSQDALDIVKFQADNQEFNEKYFFTIADVYLDHNYLTLLQTKLEVFTRKTSDAALKEKARFYLLQVYYNKNEFTTTLYGLKNLLKNLKNEILEPRIKLMIARCHLRLDNKDESALAYMDYAEQFPRRRLADDAAWKAAWIYEEQGMTEKALAVYKKIIQIWPRSSYASESKFRIGLAYYRLGWYNNAETVFIDISASARDKFDEHRGRFWLAKTYRASNREYEADEELIRLGGHVFDSYYATKSYMMFRTQVDSLFHVDQFLRNSSNPLNEHKNTQAAIMPGFRQIFLIDELLGKESAFKELNENRYSAKSLSDWVGLAEIYKRLEAYNRAYRIYDHIDNKYFAGMISYEKPFILKESYPLYYDNVVHLFTQHRGLDENLVLAVIRAESGYDRNAHSWANAYGLMQLIPRTAREVAQELNMPVTIPAHLLDPETNINLGTYYLTKLLKKFDNRITFALAAYNAGPHRVDRWRQIEMSGEDDLFIENIEFSQTRNYVRKVLRNYWVYTILSRYY